MNCKRKTFILAQSQLILSSPKSSIIQRFKMVWTINDAALSSHQTNATFFFRSIFSVEGELLAYAFGILCEYIPKCLVEMLSAHLGLEKLNPLKRKSLGGLEHKALKRVKSQEDLTFQIETKPAVMLPERKVSAKEKSLEKAARGTKSISSFFTKK